jgi:hypothetical protein
MPQPNVVNVDVQLAGIQAAAKKKFHQWLLGGDPEVFVKDRATGKIITSEAAKIGGEKGNGKPFGPSTQKFRILEDNVAVELNFPPSHDVYAFHEKMELLREALEAYLYTKAMTWVPTSQHKFTIDQLATPKAQVFGCDPDYNAYDTSSDEPAGRVVDPTKIGNLRFCGGHIHLGFDNQYNIPLPALVILVDMFIGLPSLQYDTQYERRKHYGLAGLYRDKPYGLEYRTMSNWWLRPEQTGPAFQMFKEVFNLMQCFTLRPNELSFIFDRMPLKDIQVAIDTENKKAAKEIWADAYALSVEQDLSLGYHFPCR